MSDLQKAKEHIRALIAEWNSSNGGIEMDAACEQAQAFLSRLDAEGQTVEGGDEHEDADDDLPAGPTPSILAGAKLLQTLYRNPAPHAAAPGLIPGTQETIAFSNPPDAIFAQPEHDRTVRLATLEEAAKIADSAGSFWRGHPNGAHARAIAKAIRSLIDQTGGEGGI